MGLFKRKDSRKYWMRLRVNGKKTFETTGTSNRKLAERIYAKRVTEIEEGKWFNVVARRKKLKDLVEKFEAEHTDNKDYYQRARDKTIFKKLYSFFGEGCSLEKIETTIGGYERFRRNQGAKPATIVKELSLLRRMFNVARKQWKWKMNNPVSEIELPRVRNERVRYLFQDEHKRLFEALATVEEQWLKPVVIIALDTGLRLANLCELSWSEVNMFNRMIIINAEKMKNDDYLGIPLTERAYNTFKELQKVKSISGNVFHDGGEKIYPVKVRRAFYKVLTKARITDFRFHDLRHTYGSYLRQNGVDIHTISKLMGHRDLRMSQRYAHLSAENLREAISMLDKHEGNVLGNVLIQGQV